jgi:protein-tyrosine phosphatase
MPPLRLLTVPPSELDAAAAQEAASTLDAGGVVGLPTETVYGLCCRASHPAAAERIFKMKGRAPEKALPYLIADADAVYNFVNAVPRAAQKLMDRFWPGPLTLVLGGGAGVAFRLPDHDFTRAVLRSASGPVMGTSANRSGEKPATTARRVQRYFAEELDLLVDAGKSRLGTESTIVSVRDGEPPKILRVGQLGEETVGAAMATTILLVCTGNTCRSPMAATLMRARLAARLQSTPDRLERAGFRVLSAGTAAFPGSPITREALEVLREHGLDASTHAARPLTPDLMSDADLVFTMTRAQLEAVRGHPSATARRVLLLDPDGRDIEDPIGSPIEAYRDAFDQLGEAIDRRVDELAPRDRAP